MKKSKDFNPFYSALVVIGIAFLLTACTYGVVAVKKVDPLTSAKTADAALVDYIDQKGPQALLIELALLATTSVAAMATDGYWTRRKA